MATGAGLAVGAGVGAGAYAYHTRNRNQVSSRNGKPYSSNYRTYPMNRQSRHPPYHTPPYNRNRSYLNRTDRRHGSFGSNYDPYGSYYYRGPRYTPDGNYYFDRYGTKKPRYRNERNHKECTKNRILQMFRHYKKAKPVVISMNEHSAKLDIHVIDLIWERKDKIGKCTVGDVGTCVL